MIGCNVKLTSCDMRPLRIVSPPPAGGAGGSSAGSGCKAL